MGLGLKLGGGMGLSLGSNKPSLGLTLSAPSLGLGLNRMDMIRARAEELNE